MPQEWRHESEDLEDYEVLDATDTLAGAPGDDPLDRGVIVPTRWSAGMRFGSTAAEQESGQSLDQLLALEEPDISPEPGGGGPGDDGWDENATEDDVSRLAQDLGPDPRTGRLRWRTRTRFRSQLRTTLPTTQEPMAEPPRPRKRRFTS